MSKFDGFQSSSVLVSTKGTTFLKKFFSRTHALRGKEKNYVQLTFDDSHICYVSKFNGFQSSFVLAFTNGTTLP